MQTHAFPVALSESATLTSSDRYRRRVCDMRELLDDHDALESLLHDLMAAPVQQDRGFALREELQKLEEKLLATGLESVTPG